MKITSHGQSHAGCLRDNNEDAFLIDDSGHLLAVADGLGGLPDGEDASQLALETLAGLSAGYTEGSPPDFESLFQKVNTEVHRIGSKRYRDTSIGTTLTSVYLAERRLYVGHVGDSAAFLWRQGELHTLTEEHTMAALYGGSHGNRGEHLLPDYYFHTLTRCIGATATLEPAVGEFELFPGDRLLLCTDGLTKVLSPAQLRATLGEMSTARQTVEILTEMALEQGAPDNLALIVAFVED
jgi:PPM family protein phosphatase